jgi:hypothetical protein
MLVSFFSRTMLTTRSTSRVFSDGQRHLPRHADAAEQLLQPRAAAHSGDGSGGVIPKVTMELVAYSAGSDAKLCWSKLRTGIHGNPITVGTYVVYTVAVALERLPAGVRPPR